MYVLIYPSITKESRFEDVNEVRQILLCFISFIKSSPAILLVYLVLKYVMIIDE